MVALRGCRRAPPSGAERVPPFVRQAIDVAVEREEKVARGTPRRGALPDIAQEHGDDGGGGGCGGGVGGVRCGAIHSGADQLDDAPITRERYARPLPIHFVCCDPASVSQGDRDLVGRRDALQAQRKNVPGGAPSQMRGSVRSRPRHTHVKCARRARSKEFARKQRRRSRHGSVAERVEVGEPARRAACQQTDGGRQVGMRRAQDGGRRLRVAG